MMFAFSSIVTCAYMCVAIKTAMVAADIIDEWLTRRKRKKARKDKK